VSSLQCISSLGYIGVRWVLPTLTHEVDSKDTVVDISRNSYATLRTVSSVSK
jgi:hypothetical protein